MITFEDCRRELLDRGGESVLAAYQAWLDRPGYQPVHELVHGFKHDYLLRITHNELLDARARSEHALGDVRTEEQMAEVEDWTTPFAFQHLFHKYIEVERKVPTWQDFAAWLRGDAAAFFIHPLLEHVGWETADRERRRKLKRAFRWRIGKFYLSSMRELDVFVRLRSVYGIPVRYHVLADVLLRVDLWHGDDLVCLYFHPSCYLSMHVEQ